MSVCCCSLAGTAACKSCSNNPYADYPPTIRTNTTVVTDKTFYTYKQEKIKDDTISRRAAVDVLKVAYWDNEIQSVKDDPCIVDAMTDWAIRQVKALPSAQPEPQWIPWWTPCNKRLPKGRELVNVSCHDDSGDTSYDYSSCGWVTDDGEYWIVDNEVNSHVVAWMPLPRPYKGEKNE